MHPTLQETLALVRRAHKGQVDKAGRPYHEHLERVLARMMERWPNAMLAEQHAALLHDILEDTKITAEDLEGYGYSSHEISIVQAVTRPRNSQSYLEWIQALADRNFVSAIMVKWADNRDNADPDRLALLQSDVSQALAKRYEAARLILEVPLAQFRLRQLEAETFHRHETLRFFADPPIVWRNAGDTDVNGGPITESGWYVDPYCHPMCCRPDGPFSTSDDARNWAWTEYEIPAELRVSSVAPPDSERSGGGGCDDADR